LILKQGNRRRLSPRTIETYQNCLERFFRKYPIEPRKVTKKDVKDFLDGLIAKDKAGGTIHVYLNALKFFFEECLGKKMRLDIKYCKRPKTLPLVLSKAEIKTMIENIKNHKHKIMIALMYSAGLRVSELLNLKVQDFNFKEGYGFVRQGKGMKDRLFVIAEKLRGILLQICAGRKQDDFVFVSNRGKRYDVRSIQEIIKKASKMAGINKKVHPHTLRHSFATHLIENGYSVSDVQALLGHKSPETTMMYLHTASRNMLNIESPFDNL